MDDAKNTILSMKCARIIELLSVRFDGCLAKALDLFYYSDILQLIQDGVADLHCRSYQYLADEVYYEYFE